MPLSLLRGGGGVRGKGLHMPGLLDDMGVL